MNTYTSIKEKFYENIMEVSFINTWKGLRIMENFNIRTCSVQVNIVTDRYGDRVEDDSNRSLISFCETQTFEIQNGCFSHKKYCVIECSLNESRMP